MHRGASMFQVWEIATYRVGAKTTRSYFISPSSMFLQVFFFNVGPPKEDMFFWPPSMVYISVIIEFESFIKVLLILQGQC